MKKIISAILMALAIIASSSCSKQEVDGSEAQTISVKENNLKIPAKGGEGTIEFVTESPIEVTVDKDWCQVSVKDNVATVTAPANESYESRYATVTVKSGDAKSDSILLASMLPTRLSHSISLTSMMRPLLRVRMWIGSP